jgi:hypothetical protein
MARHRRRAGADHGLSSFKLNYALGRVMHNGGVGRHHKAGSGELRAMQRVAVGNKKKVWKKQTGRIGLAYAARGRGPARRIHYHIQRGRSINDLKL